MFIATGTYRIERGTGRNSYGDEVDVAEYTKAGVIMALTDKSRRASGSDNFTRERVVLGRSAPRTDVREGDRLFCEQSAEQFVVTMVNRGDGVNVMLSDTTFECSRTTPDQESTP